MSRSRRATSLAALMMALFASLMASACTSPQQPERASVHILTPTERGYFKNSSIPDPISSRPGGYQPIAIASNTFEPRTTSADYVMVYTLCSPEPPHASQQQLQACYDKTGTIAYRGLGNESGFEDEKPRFADDGIVTIRDADASCSMDKTVLEKSGVFAGILKDMIALQDLPVGTARSFNGGRVKCIVHTD